MRDLFKSKVSRALFFHDLKKASLWLIPTLILFSLVVSIKDARDVRAEIKEISRIDEILSKGGEYSYNGSAEFTLDTNKAVISRGEKTNVGEFISDNEAKIVARAVFENSNEEMPVTIESSNEKADQYKIVIDNKTESKPGKYKLKIELEEKNGKIQNVEKDFSWGVLAVDFDKSSYKINEKANIFIAVLDNLGKTVCDAKVWLNIEKPNGEIAEFSTENNQILISNTCQNGNVTNNPDYYLNYVPDIEGEYQVALKTENANGIKQTSSKFTVNESPEYVVERFETSTRIYPPSDYKVNIKVRGVKGFSGRIKEKVPESFEISEVVSNFGGSTNAGRVENWEEGKSVDWDVDLKANEEITLSYKYKAPNVSPEFYLLGPLEIWRPMMDIDGRNFGKIRREVVFSEPRSWQIAADADPNMMLFWDGNCASPPAGWSVVSDGAGEAFYDVTAGGLFARGEASYSRYAGGALTHTHSATVSGGTPTGSSYKSGSGSTHNDSAHTHTGQASSVASVSSLPAYTNLCVIQASGIPSTIPSGAIAIFNTAPSGDWSNVSATYSSNPFIRGNSSAGGTGGSNTHQGSGHSVTGITLNQNTTDVNNKNGSTANRSSTTAHYTAHTVSNQTSDTLDTQPKYVEVYLGKATTDTTAVNGMIGMFDGSAFETSGWASVSDSGGDFYQRFIKVTGAYGTQNGADTHHHADITGVTSGSGGGNDSSGNGNGTIAAHTHDVTIAFNDGTETNNPPYTNVVFGLYTVSTTIDITGTVYGTDESTPDTSGPLVRVKVDGTGDYSATANGSGVYTVTGVSAVAGGESLAIYLDTAGAGPYGVTYTVSTGSNMNDIHLYEDRITTRCDNTCSLTNADINDWDKDNDSDIHASSDATPNLTVDNDWKLLVATDTFAPGGSITLSTGGASGYSGDLEIKSGTTLNMSTNGLNISGNYLNSGTATLSSNTTSFTKTSGTQTLNSGGVGAGKLFNNFTHSGAGTLQLSTNNLDVDGTFSQSSGIFNSNSLDQNFSGDLSLSSGTTYTKGGTLTFDGSSQVVTDATASPGQDLGVVIIGPSTTTSVSTANKIHVTTLTTGADDALDISNDTLTIRGTGTPFTEGGAFTVSSSTVIYSGSSATNITTTQYNNLTITPESGTPTYSLLGDLTSGNALLGNLTISANATLDSTVTPYNITLAGNWTNSGSFAPNSSSVDFSGSGTQQVNAGGTAAGKAFSALTHSGSGTLQLTSSGIDVNGAFSQTAGIFDCNSQNQNFAGSVSLSIGTAYMSGGTLTFDGTTAFSDATATIQDLGAVTIGPSTTSSVTTSTDIKATSLTIGADDTLNISDDIFTISGTGTPLAIIGGGTFTTTNSTVIYSGTTTTTDITTTAYNNLTLTPSSSTTYNLTGDLTSTNALTGNLTINANATLDAVSGSNYNIALGGSWDNNGTFTAQNGLVYFEAGSGSKTIEAGSSNFYDVEFNNGSGGWTIQTENLVVHDLDVTDVSSLTLEASRTLQISGTYTITDGEQTATTFDNLNSVFYLNGTSQTIGSKNQSAEVYAALQVGANTDIKTWQSSATTYTVDASGSLYSQNHANVNGDLYVWGDYHVDTNDYWNYATDFDGTDLTGSERQVDVRIDTSSKVTVDSGDTLASVGTTIPNRTTVSRIGASNGYEISVLSGGTINFQYTDFDYLDGALGVEIQAGSTVTSLDFTDFDNLVGSAATNDAYITVASSVIGSGAKTITGVNFDNTDATVDFNVNRTGTDDIGYWDFDASTGTYDGESYDGDDGLDEADPGMLKWDDSIANQSPDTPTNLGPAGYIDASGWMNDNSPTFNFDITDPDPSEQVKYRIQIDDTLDFSSIVLDYQPSSYGAEGTYNYTVGQAGSYAVGSESMTLNDSSGGGGYYWRVKAIDDDLAESAYEEAGVDATIDFRVDATAPTGGTIYDGTDGTDDSYNSGSLSDLSAYWTSAEPNFNNSGKAATNVYQYAIGTTAGGNDVKDWTYTGTSGTDPYIDATGLTLRTGQTYYFSVKATDAAGNTTSGINSDGIAVAPTLTFGYFSGSTITFNDLNSGNFWTDESKNTVLQTSTNAYGGYIIKARAIDKLRLVSRPTEFFSHYTSPNTAPTTWSGTGFGYTTSDDNLSGGTADRFTSGGPNYAGWVETGPGDPVADHTATVTGTPISNEQFTITYKVTGNSMTAAGTYQTTIVYTCIPQY